VYGALRPTLSISTLAFLLLVRPEARAGPNSPHPERDIVVVLVWRVWRIFWEFGEDFEESVGNKAICLLRSTVSVLLTPHNIIDECKFDRTAEMIHFEALIPTPSANPLSTQRRPFPAANIPIGSPAAAIKMPSHPVSAETRAKSWAQY